MEVFSSNIKKDQETEHPPPPPLTPAIIKKITYILGKSFLIFLQMQLCTFRPKFEGSTPRKFLRLHTMEAPKKTTYFFSKGSFSYISRNRYLQKLIYISGNRNLEKLFIFQKMEAPKKFLIFQEVTFRTQKVKSFLHFGRKNFLASGLKKLKKPHLSENIQAF